MINNFDSLLSKILDKNIVLQYNDGKLTYEISEEYYSDELLDAIKKYKKELIEQYCPLIDKTNILTFNTSGSEIPFFFVHGDQANYLLKKAVGKEQPFYGFLHLGSDGEKIPFSDIKTLAQLYLKQLLSIKPNGPYILGGYSIGGNIAYEMSILLQTMGHDVPKLILFDSPNLGVKESFNWNRSAYVIVRNSFIKPLYYKLHSLYIKSKCFPYRLLGKSIPINWRRNYIFTIYFKMMRNYKKSDIKFNGEILLIRAEKNESTLESLGWDQETSKLTLTIVKGDHHDFFTIKECIETIEKNIKMFLNRPINIIQATQKSLKEE